MGAAMDRRSFVRIVASLAGMATATARAQQPRTYRIGYLHPIREDAAYAAFLKALEKLGYSVSRNVILEARFAEGKVAGLSALAAELVAKRVDVIVAVSPTAIRAARAATRTIPIVMAFSGDDPVESGFAVTLARPGGNTTGLTAVAHDIAPKWIELLAEFTPDVKLIGVLRSPNRADHDKQIEVMRIAAQAQGIRLHVAEVHAAENYADALAAISNAGSRALVVLSGPEFTHNRHHLIELVTRHGLPSVYQFAEFVAIGGLVSYGPDIAALSARAAVYVDRILRGANPAELPIEQPSKLLLVINRKTANALGVKIPPALLLQADQVIQ
jgi:putative ABC transport system substrate-binding protein